MLLWPSIAYLLDVAEEERLPEVVALVEDDWGQEPQKEERRAETGERIWAKLCCAACAHQAPRTRVTEGGEIQRSDDVVSVDCRVYA